MPTRFIHTADWQLGKPFASVEDESRRSLLHKARLDALGRIARLVVEHEASFVVVAGDLFDSPHADKRTVSAACAAIGAMKVPVYAIPGNHDHGGPSSLWTQPFFNNERVALAPNFRPLLGPEPVSRPDALLLPCPLGRRHEMTDPTQWVQGIPNVLWEAHARVPRILLAHGSVQDFTTLPAAAGWADPDAPEESSSANRIHLDRLPARELDYIALGDWHGTREVGANAWYSGTPEPDRFRKGEDHDPGNVLLVEVERGRPATVTRHPTQQVTWHALEMDLADDAAIETLKQRVAELTGNRVDLDLLRLSLTGSLGIEAGARLQDCLETYRARLLRFDCIDQTRVTPTQAELESLTLRSGDPLISRVATLLQAEAATGGDQGALAGIALRELHAACHPTSAGGDR